jgi:hypothetical protein
VQARASLQPFKYTFRQRLNEIFFGKLRYHNNQHAALVGEGCRVDRVSARLMIVGPGDYASIDAYDTDFAKWLKSENQTYSAAWLEGSPKQDLIRCVQFLYHCFVTDTSTPNDAQRAEQVQISRTEELWRTLVYNRTSEGAVPPPEWASLFSVLINGPSMS